VLYVTWDIISANLTLPRRIGVRTFNPGLVTRVVLAVMLVSVLGVATAARALRPQLDAPAPVAPQDAQQYVKLEGELRSYVVHLPLGYNAGSKYPLVLLLHGADQNAQDVARFTRFDFLSDRYGFIGFYPNSDDVTWNIGVPPTPLKPSRRRKGRGNSDTNDDEDDPGLNFPKFPTFFVSPGASRDQEQDGHAQNLLTQGGPTLDGQAQGGQPQGKPASQDTRYLGDVPFFNAMLDKLAADYSVDAHRIFVTGYSDGGMMAFRLGCSMSTRVAAIAPVASAMPKTMADGCQPSRAIPLLMINGAADPGVPYGGGIAKGAGVVTLSAQASAETWAKLDRCEPRPIQSVLPRGDKQKPTIRIDAYSDCGSGAEVILYTIDGGGSTWPGGDQSATPAAKKAGKTGTDLDAGELVWKFFSAHPLPPASSAQN